MGYGMASNIRKKMPPEYVLYVFDVSASVCQRFKRELGGYGRIEIVDSARAVAEDAVGVVSILPSAAVVQETFLNKKTGIVAAIKNVERILLECSTIDSYSVQRIGREAIGAASGVYVDSPVSVRRRALGADFAAAH